MREELTPDADMHARGCRESPPDPALPVATIIIPVYNMAATLARAIDSALRQTERAIEVIVVDDGSSDRSLAVAERAAALDDRVIVLRSEKNGGKPVSMNSATRRARGRWIAVLDADDWYDRRRIAKLVAIAERRNFDLIADNQHIVDATARRTGLLFRPGTGIDRFDLDDLLAGSDPLSDRDVGLLKPVVSATFLREHGLEYLPLARNGHDFYFLLAILLAGARAGLTSEPFYTYVRHDRRAARPPGDGYRPYLFDRMKQANEHYLASAKPLLTADQFRRLTGRGRDFDRLVLASRFREAVRRVDLPTIMKAPVRAPCILVLVALRRGWARLTGRPRFLRKSSPRVKASDT